MRIRSAAAATIVGVLTIVASITSAGATATDGVVGAAPTPGSALAAQGGYYQLTGAPGSSTTQSVRVTNPTDEPIDVRIAGVDGLTDASLMAAYASPGVQAAKVGTWLTPRDVEFHLAAHETRDEPFTVHVPVDAAPGVHLGAVTVYTPARDQNGSQNEGDVNINIKVRAVRTIAVEVDVPGPAVPNLEVTGAKALVDHSGVLLGVDMANTGTGYAHGNGIIRVAKTGLAHEFEIHNFVPDTSLDFTVPWMPDARQGAYPVHVHLAWDNGKTLDWDGVVNVTGRTKADLANVKVSAPSSTAKRSSSTSMLAVALVAVGTVLALALLGAVVYAVSSRRRRRPRRGARATRATTVTTDEPASRQDRRRHRRNASRGRHGRTRTGRAQATSRTARRR
jgi:hypothetical protein